MSSLILKEIIDNQFDNLPAFYQNLDLSSFSLDIELYDYQLKAVKNILTALEFYFNESPDGDDLYSLYQKYGLTDSQHSELNIKEDKQHFDLLKQYYDVSEELVGDDTKQFINFKEFINRASVWMATGSGKTIIMVKLIGILQKLIQKGLIPEKPIMILAPKPKILRQIKKHVNKFNNNSDVYINLISLKKFFNRQRSLNYSSNQQIDVFYYNSTNISDEENTSQKSDKDGKRIDFAKLRNQGNWYIFLDEAHKGDSQDSIRQQYYNILSQNGFLFNFSATFTDPIDKVSAAAEFNLSSFINKGYGKHIKISNEEYRNFKDKEDFYSDKEKQNIILKSIITFVAIKKNKEKLDEFLGEKIYHNPLMLTITNTVNTKDAELKLFFRQISKIAQGDYDLETPRLELARSYRNDDEFLFESNETLKEDIVDTIDSITKQDVLKHFFNSDEYGNLEVTTIPGNQKEVAFRLVSSSKHKHFASIIIGDISKWRSQELIGYSQSQTPNTDSFFEDINNPDSGINLLMGSQIFSEGWDSNRPNVINYINVGMDSESQKFIQQATGRGVRIEPFKNQKERLSLLKAKGNLIDYLDLEQQAKVREYNQPIETLFIFATKKQVVKNIINKFEQEQEETSEYRKVKNIEKNDKITSQAILVPRYKKLYEEINPNKFSISRRNIDVLKQYFNSTSEKVLLVKYNILDTRVLKIIKDLIVEKDSIIKDFFIIDNSRKPMAPEDVLLKIVNHFNKSPKQLDRYELVSEHINHYNFVEITDITQQELDNLETKLKQAINNIGINQESLITQLQNGKITSSEFAELNDTLSDSKQFGKDSNCIKINNRLTKHYYQPILSSNKDNNPIANSIRHIIKEGSEIDFLKELEDYLKNTENKLDKYDWWFFSKIDESLDTINIPYFDRSENDYRLFYPDFVFWMKDEDKYYITFVDPKGTENPRNTNRKIKGFYDMFDNQDIQYNYKTVEVSLYCWNKKPAISEMEEKIAKSWQVELDEIF